MDPRRQRGLELAATTKIRRKGKVWIIPSQSGKGHSYNVELNKDGSTCTCADHEMQKVKCKHIFAAEFIKQRETLPEGIVAEGKTAKPTYKQNWPAYNAAQSNEKDRVFELLRGLCDGISQPPQGRGRPRLPLSDMIFCAVTKVYCTMSGRRTSSDLRDCEARGLVANAPHYNSVFNALDNAAITPILKALIEESATPLKAVETDFAVDSSGFSTSTYARWFDAKYGRLHVDRYWVKAHLIIGVKTNIVSSVEVTGPEANDYPVLAPLLDATIKNFSVQEVSADKGYIGRTNLEKIVSVGAVPYIPFKSNATGKGSELWRKMWHYYEFSRPEFLAKYHKRSNVESTFSMIKAKFGASVRSKTPTAQMNEVLCKVLCHNLCCLVHSIYELELEPIFWAA
ncbi:transposase [Granulicella sibirica]|uniref:SWIM-type domain-containing protein n=1 Tax=Granulicella sibirica TaxID=2479048 RepID=A0A4Q0SZ37_9BACT|nr:transposase [Granulicella sibirica]RXH55270.1 hypothetical protein GRAN_4374 [Granulicella sibirica]